MSAALVGIENLHKRFVAGSPLRRLIGRGVRSEREVLCGVDLRVERGEMVAILGANGAGKTTILKTIAALLLPTSGSVRVGGHDVAREVRQVRGLTGYVLADERSFHWRLTARENLEFFAALGGLHGAQRRIRIRTLLERLDLLDAADRSFGEFSTGMKQRLAIARALLARPRVLLMDEPTRSVDAPHAAAIWQLVREETADVDGCVMLVTHQMGEALSACGRIAVLDGGRIISDTPTQAAASYATGLDGYVVSVQGLSPAGLAALERIEGVCGVRVASRVGGEQVLELWTRNGDVSVADFIGAITGAGAMICSLQRATPLQGVLGRLGAAVPMEAHA